MLGNRITMIENMLLRLECQKVKSNNLIGIKIMATFDLMLDTACQSFIYDDGQTLEKSDISSIFLDDENRKRRSGKYV